MAQIVPTQHRDADRKFLVRVTASSRLYRILCLPDAEWQRGYLEQLRHKWRYRDADFRVIQWLHDRQWRIAGGAVLATAYFLYRLRGVIY